MAAPGPPEAQPAAGCSPTAFVPVSMLLPMGSAPSCGLSRLGLAPGDCFGDNRSGEWLWGVQPPHPQSCPAAWLGAVAHTCGPAPGGGMSPGWLLSVSHCVFQCWQRSQCPGALSRPHVSTPGAPAAGGSCCQWLCFPSLHPGLLLHWLGLLWLRGHPCSVTLSPAQAAPAALLWAWLCHISGDLLGSRPGSLWSPSCHSVLLPNPLGFPLPSVPCACLESTVEGPVLVSPLCQGSRAKTK